MNIFSRGWFLLLSFGLLQRIKKNCWKLISGEPYGTFNIPLKPLFLGLALDAFTISLNKLEPIYLKCIHLRNFVT